MKTTGLRFRPLLLGLLLPLFAACTNDNSDDGQVTPYSDGTVGVELTIQTRAITSTSETYVVGSEWENYIDINGGDYRIYFFTYDPDTETEAGKGVNSTLIAEFTPTDIFSTNLSTYTNYTMSSEIDKSLISSLTDFKVVVLANWGSYPTVTAGITTIDDICNAGTFNAFVDGSGNATLPSENLRIPFYGVHEYSSVTWTADRQTNLGTITLLRAVAKVEVIVESAENQDLSFADVSLINYNTQGYCAPSGVYLKGDYDHDYTWAEDFVDGLHLVSM